jgi:hypothetical protein
VNVSLQSGKISIVIGVDVYSNACI